MAAKKQDPDVSTEDPQSTRGESLLPFLHFTVTANSLQTCDPPGTLFIHCPHCSILLPGAKSSKHLITAKPGPFCLKTPLCSPKGLRPQDDCAFSPSEAQD